MGRPPESSFARARVRLLRSFVSLSLLASGALTAVVGVDLAVAPPAHADNASDYASAVKADNPISYWQLNDGSGTTAVDQMGLNNGTISGGVTLNAPGPMTGANAMTFDGGSGLVRLPGSTSLQPTAAISLEAWALTSQGGGGYPNENMIFRSRTHGYSLNASGGKFGGFVCGVNFGCNEPAPTVSAFDGTWHYLVLSYDGANVRYYVDGQLTGSIANTDPIYYTGTGIAIGEDGDCGCSYFNGSIAEVAVYNHALSADRVSAHFAAGGSGLTASNFFGSGNYMGFNPQCNTKRPVNCATGNFWHTFDDLDVPGRGLPLHLERTYNSLAAGTDGPFGFGWSSGYSQSLTTDPSSGALTVHEENGSTATATTCKAAVSWVQQNPATSPSVRSSVAMAYDKSRSKVVLFGGNNGSYLGDTWTWGGTTWAQQSPATSPPGRAYAMMAFDAAHNQAVLFGGFNGSDLGDTWTWDGTTWTQQNPATSPSRRQEAAMAYDTATGNVVLFGGYDGTNYLGDTWVWDGTTWTQQNPASSPSGRKGDGLAYDEDAGVVVLFGGYSGGGIYNSDTWMSVIT